MSFKDMQLDSSVLNKHKIGALVCFGSEVTGRKHPRSDIDIGVIFKNPEVHIKKPVEVYGDLYEQLGPLASSKRKLDIVYLDEVPISLRFRAVEEGVPFYISDRKFFADYREDTMREYYDFKPVLDEFRNAFLGNV